MQIEVHGQDDVDPSGVVACLETAVELVEVAFGQKVDRKRVGKSKAEGQSDPRDEIEASARAFNKLSTGPRVAFLDVRIRTF